MAKNVFAFGDSIIKAIGVRSGRWANSFNYRLLSGKRNFDNQLRNIGRGDLVVCEYGDKGYNWKEIAAEVRSRGARLFLMSRPAINGEKLFRYLGSGLGIEKVIRRLGGRPVHA